MRLILASASPRRAELLRAAGYTFDVVVTDVDESIRPAEAPSAYVRRLAADKSMAAVKGLAADDVVLGADTTVVVDGEILGKPRDDEEGREMLRRLSGRTHQVLTGVSLRYRGHEAGRVETTLVTFRVLTDEDIFLYVASGEGRDKAGGYAIQGLASRFIPAVSGSYANVVGLPVASVDELLRSLLASCR